MVLAHTRKSDHKRSPSRISGPRRTQASAITKQKQNEEIDRIIGGLTALIAAAESASIGTAARILHSAKEEIVYWAVTMKCHDSKADKFINHHLYDNRLFLALPLAVQSGPMPRTKNRIT